MGVRWQDWGTTVSVDVTDPAALAPARRLVARYVAQARRAADVSWPGSRVHRLLGSNGVPVPVHPVLSGLVATALDAAESSGGLVDPTVGTATIPLNRTLGRIPRQDTLLPVCSAFPVVRPVAGSGWEGVRWSAHHVAVPAGTALDLTATAKARTARLAASQVALRLGVGAIVEIGGDVATAGPAPAGGWRVSPLHLGGRILTLEPGMSLAVCRSRGVVDPATARCVTGPWEAVGVRAPDVVLAKTAAVAALVHGPDAEAYLDGRGLAAGVFGRKP
ncbi:MAG: FAD:protein transferase [Actinomycetota bacterium]|nr:FAD:protein transferase [Actinomycetota bacterium]